MAEAVYVDVKPRLNVEASRRFHAEAQQRLDALREDQLLSDFTGPAIQNLRTSLMMTLEFLVQLTEGT